jgi:TIR domain/Protein of unknown function (DUF3298)
MTTSDFVVFISYARSDRSSAEEIYDFLVVNGFDAWLDSRKIKGGQNWDFEIKKSLDRSSVILVLLSKSSVDHRGYAQREIKVALGKYEEKLIDDIFIIPVILDEFESIPFQFKEIHCLRFSDKDFHKNILESLNHQIERLGGERKNVQEKLDIFWVSRTIKEEWEGSPGYDAEIEILEFRSEKYLNVNYIGDFIKGQMLEYLIGERNCKFEQDTEFHSLGKDKWLRTNTFDAFCGDPEVCGSVISICYNISYYSGGAAHPNHGFRTFSFVLGPMIYISSLRNVFKNEEEALSRLQSRTIELLIEASKEVDEEGDTGLEIDEGWARDGTKGWDDFSNFTFRENCLKISFGSYQVAPYAAGTPSVEIPYKEIYKLFKNDYVQSLRLSEWNM